MLAINVVTLLSPNGKSPSPAVFSKKFGAKPKSNSNPTGASPIHPSDAPNVIRFSNSSSKSKPDVLNEADPPQFTPMNGVNSQSADAFAGAAANTAMNNAAVITNLRTAMS